MEVNQGILVKYRNVKTLTIMSLIALLLGCLSFLLTLAMPSDVSSLTTVPTKMNFQGRLTDSAGNIKPNGTYNMKLRLYTASSGGTAVWTEDRLVSATQGVTVTNGLFTVQLGSITTLPASLFASGALYLEVELPTPATATSSSPTWTEGAMTPRNQMATSAYAYNAETLDGLDSAAFGQLTANNTWSGISTFTGDYGVNNAVSAFYSSSYVEIFSPQVSLGDGTNTLFSTNNSLQVQVGSSLADGSGVVLILDTKNTAGDPTGANGAMYYNSNAGKLRCYQAGAWTDCIGTGGSSNADTLDTLDSTAFAQLGSANTFTAANTFNGATFAIGGTANAAKFNVASLFNVDSSAGKVAIGASDTTGTVFILDTKTGSGDPTGSVGAMYYNSNDGKFRCYQVSAWKNCDDGGDATTVDGVDSTAFSQLSANNTFTGTAAFNGTTFSIGGTANAAKFNVASLFNVDSSGSKITIGASDTTGTVFVLDTKTDATDPTGEVGAMYYNSNLGKFRCYQVSAWKNCDDGGSASYATTAGSATTATTATNATNATNASNADTLDGVDSTGIVQIVANNVLTGTNTFRNSTNSTSAFSIQDSNSNNLFQIGTSDMKITLGASGSFDTMTEMIDPATLPTGAGRSTAFSPDGMYLSVGHTSSPYISIYKRSGDTFTKLANPATLPTGDGYGTAFSLDGQYLSVAHLTSPYITIYKRSGDTFTKLANPATLPTGTGRGTAFSPDGQYLSVAHLTSPYITIYKRSGDTFTKLTNPGTLPTNTATGTAFSPDGQYMSVTTAVSPYIFIYKRSGDTFTKLTNPGTLPTGSGNGTAFSPDGTYLSVAHTTTPYITIYKRSGDTFTKLTNPGTLPAGDANGTSFSQDGLYMSVAHSTSPSITIYKRSDDVFTKLANPPTLPFGAGNATAFSRDGQYVSVANSSSPYMTVYKAAGQKVSTAVEGSVAVSNNLTANNLTVAYGITSASLLTSGLQVNGNSEFRAAVDSDATFAILDSAGLGLFEVDTVNDVVQIGSATADGTGVVLVLDTKNTAGDPTGYNGGMYYNSNLNKFRCYENGAWVNCVGGSSIPSVRSFIDTTSDAIVDANTTNYWDVAVENNNATPNFTTSSTSNSILGFVSMEVTSTGTGDTEVVARVERGIGSAPTCGSGTAVGGSPGAFSSNTGGKMTSTVTFLDTPATASTVYYVLCSDAATVGTTGNVTRIRITLQEVTNSN